MRLDRLYALIRACSASIHDLSYVRTDGAPGQRVPRFNMPFEAGLAIAHSLSSGKHSAFFLEAEPYRLQRSLGDVNGLDPAIHHGTPSGMVRCVLGLLGHGARGASAAELVTLAAAVRVNVRRRVRIGELSSVLSADGFNAAAKAIRQLLAPSSG